MNMSTLISVLRVCVSCTHIRAAARLVHADIDYERYLIEKDAIDTEWRKLG